jgi:putative transposase
MLVFRRISLRRKFAVKKTRYSTEQIVAALKQAEMGMAVADLVRQLGISEMTFCRWKKKYGGLESDQVPELKQVLDENTRRKKLVAELSLDKAVLQDVRSQAIAHQAGCRLYAGLTRLHRARGLPVDTPASLYPMQAFNAGSPDGPAPAHA